MVPSPCSLALPQVSHPQPPIPTGIVTRSKNNITKPKSKLNLHLTTKQPIEPFTITQALRDPDWRAAMQTEYDALCKNNTWDLVPSSIYWSEHCWLQMDFSHQMSA
ncbi:hypothetical protein VIGAN_03178800 [Vigna angularis var. angularis]|uniref:Reverse transcriptase Ty1/copia-type domain-containing protein n=1 Tax=Vigna angularis var. angularis TaxID=157739 RepID=A0A0S3RMW9_PHAAN|nr:hypothetical protein VIGAN_03178800 [Vigna angularis var. angularis]